MKKVALVTGASAGIGMETAKFLANHNYTVYGAARRTERMNGLVQSGIKVIRLGITLQACLVDYR